MRGTVWGRTVWGELAAVLVLRWTVPGGLSRSGRAGPHLTGGLQLRSTENGALTVWGSEGEMTCLGLPKIFHEFADLALAAVAEWEGRVGCLCRPSDSLCTCWGGCQAVTEFMEHLSYMEHQHLLTCLGYLIMNGVCVRAGLTGKVLIVFIIIIIIISLIIICHNGLLTSWGPGFTNSVNKEEPGLNEAWNKTTK